MLNSILYLEDGGSIDLSQLATDTTFSNNLIYHNPTFITNLAGDTTFINTLTADSLFIANIDSLDEDDQNLTSFTLTGTELEVDIEDGDSVKVDLIGLATDSSFVTTLSQKFGIYHQFGYRQSVYHHLGARFGIHHQFGYR